MASRSTAATALTLLVVGGLVARATQIYFSGSKEAVAASGTGPRAQQVDPILSEAMEALYFYPEVDRYLAVFMASTDQAITSWQAEGHELPIERRDLFLQILYDFRAICTIESSGDPNAISPDENHLGICQLNRESSFFVAEGESDEILFDPHYNIYRGEWYYFVLWMNAYDRLGGTDLDRVSRHAAAGFYIGGGNVEMDESDWGEDEREYVRRFEMARQKGFYP
jgi:hypothetical protein